MDGNTVIGRASNISDSELFGIWERRISGKDHSNKGVRNNRTISFDKLRKTYENRTLELGLTDVTAWVSRRQVLFQVPEHQETGYGIVDLFSINGTRINEQYIEPGRPTLVSHGDIVSFKLSEKYDHFIEFVFKEIEKKTHYIGLIVADPDGSLFDDRQTAEELKATLTHRGFEVGLLKGQVSSRQLTEKLYEYSSRLRECDYFLLMYLGHGSSKGELVLKDRKIGVNELYDLVSNIRARKMMIFDCCYGWYYMQNIPANSAVAVSQEEKQTCTGVFSKPFIKVLEKQKEGIYIDDLVRSVCYKAEYQLMIRGIKPGAKQRATIYFASVLKDEEQIQKDRDIREFNYERKMIKEK